MGLYPNGLYGSLLDSSFQAPAHHGANSHLPNSYNAGFCFSLSYLSVESAAHFPLWNYTHPDLLRKSIVAWAKAVEISHVV
jgi:hypothetical protein